MAQITIFGYFSSNFVKKYIIFVKNVKFVAI